MKLIIAGTRTLNPPPEVINWYLHTFNIWKDTNEIVSGGAKGSSNMKMNMEKLNKPIYEVILKSPRNE